VSDPLDFSFQVLAEHSPQGIGLMELDGRLLYLNPVAIRMTGCKDAGEGPTCFNDLLPEGDRAAFERDALAKLRAEGAWQGEGRLRNLATGVTIDVEQTLFMIERGPGRPPCVGTWLRDISSRRKALVTLDNLRALVEGSTDFCATFDHENRLQYVNAAARRELGWKGGATPLAQLVAPDFSALFMDVALPAIRAGQPWSCEAALRDLNHHGIVPTWLRLFALPGLGRESGRFALIATDLREKKTAEFMLIHSSKMAALGEIAGGIAHEVNNPLMYIIERSKILRQLLTEGKSDLPAFRAALERIEYMGNRISKTIRSLRGFARNAEEDPFESIPLRTIIHETLEICAERFRNHQIEIRLRGELDLMTFCRPIQLSQVFLNLLQNSFDAISPLAERWIEIAAHPRQEGWIDLEFTDCGPGIPESIRARLLDPYFTTKPRGDGTGLGLKIATRIVIEHGGELFVDAEAKNTRFVVRLPHAPAETLTLDVA
jgi:PAS domain S-box-containing protein